MLNEYKQETGKDFIPLSGPIQSQKIYLMKAREYYQSKIPGAKRNYLS